MQISVSKQIHADFAHQHGFLGEGIGIAYLDTGLFPHKDFSPHSTRIAKFVDFVHSKSFSYDDNGHGTHITGIAASSATFGSDYLGIAPKSHIVSLKVLDASGNGVQSAFLQGLDWIHEHHRSYQIRIVNISIGSPSSEDSSASKELLKHVNALWMMVLLFVLPVETMVQNHTVFQFLVIVQKSSLLVPATIIFK